MRSSTYSKLCRRAWIAGEQLDDRVGSVHPELGGRAVGAVEPDPGAAPVVPGEVGKRVVDGEVAEPPCAAEVVGGAGDGSVPVGSWRSGSVTIRVAASSWSSASSMRPVPGER
jgi:hypothetical protein